jgi:Peptidase A4 family
MGRKITRLGALAAGSIGLIVGSGAVTPLSAAGAHLQLQPNHLSAKPPHSGGTGSTWPGWASSNWSGYAVTAGAKPVTSATAAWTVPAAAATTRASYSAAWVGIDGFNNSSLIQTGSEQDYYASGPHGAAGAHSAAWWTTSAQRFAEQPITSGCTGTGSCGAVAAGDHMTASISGAIGGSWTMQLTDATEKWSFTEGPIAYKGPGASAEWIMEAPTVGGRVAPIARYSTFPFDLGTANGVSPGLVASEGGELIQGGVVTSVPSGPDTDADGFNSAYGSVQPTAPAT